MITVQHWWLVQTFRWNMLNTFVTIYYTNFCWIRSCSLLFCTLDTDIIFGPHKFSMQANIDHQWALHVLQSLYYIFRLFPKAFFCDHDGITEYKITDTINVSKAYRVIYKLIIMRLVWDGCLVSTTSLVHLVHPIKTGQCFSLWWH